MKTLLGHHSAITVTTLVFLIVGEGGPNKVSWVKKVGAQKYYFLNREGGGIKYLKTFILVI